MNIDDRNRAPHSEPIATRPPSAPRQGPDPKLDPKAIVKLGVGGLFAAVATIFILVGLGLIAAGERMGWFFAGFPLIHFSIGIVLLRSGLRERARRRRLAHEGVATIARVTKVGTDKTVRINGRRPAKLTWTYEVAGATHTGSRSTMREIAPNWVEGDSLWILIDPEDPSVSIEWPLIG